MDNYHVLHIIGQGCFGTVFKGRRKYTGRIVALKFISKRGKSDKDLQNLRLEIGILRRLDHPNIIRMLDSFETGTDFAVVTEFAYGELFEIFQDDRNLPEDEVARIARQLVLALNYLHGQKVVHRDMKPQNVLVAAHDIIKLCDFGFARVMSTQTTVLTSIKGTPLYMAPELVRERPYDYTVDLWSLGVICYELFVGQPPFYTNSLMTLINIIVESTVTYPDNMSPAFRSFLQGLLQKNPRQRLAWPHLLHHHFVKDAPLPVEVRRTSLGRQGDGGLRRPAVAVPPRVAGESGPAAEPLMPAGLAAVAPVAAPLLPPLHGSPAVSGPLSCMGKWLPFFADVWAGDGRAVEHTMQSLDEGFAASCMMALETYAQAVEDNLLTSVAPRVERRGLLLSLVGEPRPPSAVQAGSPVPSPSLPLAPLARGLAALLGCMVPPASVLPRLLSSVAVATHLLRLLKVLAGKQGAAWGPQWDLLSDVVRLLGLWLRAPLALGMAGLVNELAVADGTLCDLIDLAPSLIAGGVLGRFSTGIEQFGATATVYHVGIAVNTVKCLGVAFAHLVQVSSASAYARELLVLLPSIATTSPAGARQSPAPQVTLASAALVRALRTVAHCAVLRCTQGSLGERLVHSALQSLAALMLPSSSSLERLGSAWAADAAGASAGGAAEGVAAEARAALGSARSAAVDALHRAAIGRGDEEFILDMLCEVGFAPGGDSFDAAALKVLLALVGTSEDMARRLAQRPALAACVAAGSGASLGKGLRLAASAVAGGPGAAVLWPGAALLLALLTACLRPFGELPYALAEAPASLPAPVPSWCRPVLIVALSEVVAGASVAEGAQSMLGISYVAELAASMCGAAMHQWQAPGTTGGNARREWQQTMVLLEAAADATAVALLRGGAGPQALEEIRRLEGTPLGCAEVRGPLDGCLGLALALGELTEALTEAPPPLYSMRLARVLLAAEDPQVVLTLLGPRGLLRLLDLLTRYREAVPSTALALRFFLLSLGSLQVLQGRPAGERRGLPHFVGAFRIAVDMIIQLLGVLSQASAAPDLFADLQRCQTVKMVLNFLSGAPTGLVAAAVGFGGPVDELWFRALGSCVQLLSVLATQHQGLAHEFVQQDGLRLFSEQRLLSAELASAEVRGGLSGAQLVADALVVISQLSRLSKEYYPSLAGMNVAPDLRTLLLCDDAGVRAKACNAVGNLARHSSAFYEAIRQADLLTALVPLCSDGDPACRKFSSFAVGNCAFHSELLYPGLAQAVPRLACLLEDEDEKTRANAAGAIGNLVRNSGELCPVMLEHRVVHGLQQLIDCRRPSAHADAAIWSHFLADSSVKIALFSLGNLAVHRECREVLVASLRTRDMCHSLMASSQREDMINKYAQRLLQKLGN